MEMIGRSEDDHCDGRTRQMVGYWSYLTICRAPHAILSSTILSDVQTEYCYEYRRAIDLFPTSTSTLLLPTSALRLRLSDSSFLQTFFFTPPRCSRRSKGGKNWIKSEKITTVQMNKMNIVVILFTLHFYTFILFSRSFFGQLEKEKSFKKDSPS